MNIPVDTGMDSLHKYGLQQDDVILYLGGRIDDDSLYPAEYRKYLNSKIKELNPNKIICHTHWYAKKYYDGGVLDVSTKIDMILVNYWYFTKGKLETINHADYGGDHRSHIKPLINKNPNMIYATYQCGICKTDSPTVGVDTSWFGEDYDFNNIKCFYFTRKYSPNDLVEGAGGGTINATDGFAVITQLVKSGFKNLNIIGFTAFGSDEDQSCFSEYGSMNPIQVAGKKYFDLKTSENQRMEADILKNYVKQKKINNLEDYGELTRHLKKNKK